MLVGWDGLTSVDAVLLLYGVVSTALFAALPALRRTPAVWAIDIAVTLAFVLQSGDWRSPFYLLWLSSLALPATALSFKHALWLATGSAIGYLLVAILRGPVPGQPAARIDRDARDPRIAAVHARVRLGLRRRCPAPAGGRAVRS